MGKKRWLAVGFLAVFILGVGSAALAGEVTGSGKRIDQNQGRSGAPSQG